MRTTNTLRLTKWIALAATIATLAACSAKPAMEMPSAEAPAAPMPQPVMAITDSPDWMPLFDGKTLTGWRAFNGDGAPKGWTVTSDGELHFAAGTANGQNAMTTKAFADFELELEWKVAEGGNSGIFYRVSEQVDTIHHLALEYQVLDDANHNDGGSGLTSAGSNYALYAPTQKVVRPAGSWNHTRIVAKGKKLQHWLNGKIVVECEVDSDDWNARKAESKFADFPMYGKMTAGHIALQDHGDDVWYKNIRIRTF